MKVTLLAHSEIDQGGYNLLQIPDDQLDTTDADHLAEIAGRACYQSWSRPNPKTAANADYLAHIIEVGHESVLAHASATFYIEGVSRSLTHELVRHRWLSFSQLSQRYVEPGDMRPVIPPAATTDEAARVAVVFDMAIKQYREAVASYEAQGLSRKRAREAARALLPNATETRIVVSGNHRAWRDFLRQRLSPHADAEINALAHELARQLVTLAPSTFADVWGWAE